MAEFVNLKFEPDDDIIDEDAVQSQDEARFTNLIQALRHIPHCGKVL